jgi:UrcA family protein
VSDQENIMKLSLSGLAALSLAGFFCANAFAQDDADKVASQVVRYADLKLDSKAGVAALYQRIQRAADQVCRKQQGVHQLLLQPEITVCTRDSADRAITEVNLPALSEMHFAKTGRGNKDMQVANKD